MTTLAAADWLGEVSRRRIAPAFTPSKLLKAVAQWAMNTLGYHIGRYPAANTIERDLKDLLVRQNVGCVLDVGAHRGEFGRMLRAIGYEGHIVSFEPVASNYAELSRRARRDGKWRTFNFALGASEAVLPINVMHGTTFDSFLKPAAYGSEAFGSKMLIERVENVPVKRLDAVLDECTDGIGHCSVFLKTDTQGYDLAVIEGAGDRLAEFCGVQVEIPAKRIYQDMSSLPETMERLLRSGLDIVGMYPVARDGTGSVVELDCVLQRAAA